MAWRLADLLAGWAPVGPGQDRDIGGLALDSRRAGPGSLFLACAGTRRHGGEFAREAVAGGAAAVAWDPVPRCPAPTVVEAGGRRVPVIACPGLSARTGEIAARFFHDPSASLRIVGVTGTNGKTSCTHLLAQAFTGAGYRCGLSGTLGAGLWGSLETSTHTTPDPVALQAMLARLLAQKADTVLMEVSSHGLEQGRVEGLRFDTAVFTNLSRDHLDYHGDMDSYGAAKLRLFGWPRLRAAVVNGGDRFGGHILRTLDDGVRALAYRLDGPQVDSPAGRAEVVLGQRLCLDADGLAMEVATPWGRGSLRAPLLGRFNAENLLAVLSVLGAFGVPLPDARELMRQVEPPAGRMERWGGGTKPLVVIDYAHTPAALGFALEALRPHARGRLWCVFGCGGDRDRGKRGEMGCIAESLADRVVVTDDNPRGEDPGIIAGEILAGMARPQNALLEHRRGRAIQVVVDAAAAGDVVLVAGKGHEEYQIIGDERLPFSDREQVLAALRDRG